MNKDTIYKEDAIEVASRECHEFRGIFSRIEKGINELPSADTFETTKEALIKAIDNAETVGDVVENIINRPQGEWIYPTDIIGFGRCSNCKALWDKSLIDNIYFKYCPRCGARMVKGVDNEH